MRTATESAIYYLIGDGFTLAEWERLDIDGFTGVVAVVSVTDDTDGDLTLSDYAPTPGVYAAHHREDGVIDIIAGPTDETTAMTAAAERATALGYPRTDDDD